MSAITLSGIWFVALVNSCSKILELLWWGTLVPLPAVCSLPLLQCLLPLEQSVGSQHHSSVISMETSSSSSNDWISSQSLPFCDRMRGAVLPAPLLTGKVAVLHTFFPSSSFFTFMALQARWDYAALPSRVASGWNAFWHGCSDERLSAEESSCLPHLSLVERMETGEETC